MTITSLDTTAYTEDNSAVEASEENIPLSAFPKLVWVGGALFTINLLIGCGLLLTPRIEADPYGREVQASDAASSKVSPFTQTVDTKRGRVKLAAKVVPVTFVPQVEEPQPSAYEAASLDLPRSSSRAYQQLDLPVHTERALYSPDAKPSPTTVRVYDNGASYNMPRNSYASPAQDNVLRHRATDVSPRRASDRDTSVVVIN